MIYTEDWLNIVSIIETDPRFGAPNIAEEKRRAMTGGV
jgi:hypothetical protein